MIKKAMILAAGLGTRLRPITDQIPKPLVWVGNRSILDHHLTQLADLGVKEVMINLHHLGQQIEEEIEDGRKWGLRVHYSDERAEILGTGGGLAKVRDFFAKEEAFLCFNGDILHSIDLSEAIARHAQNDAQATLIVKEHPKDPNIGWIGVDDEGKVGRVPEMSEEDAAFWRRKMFTGLHILTPTILPYLQARPSCVLRTGYRAMLEAGHRVFAYEAPKAAYWSDIGTPQSYLEANIEALRRRDLRLQGWLWQSQEEAAKEHPAWAETSDRAPILWGSGIRREEGAQLGPECIVGDGAWIGKNSRLRRCVICPHAQVPEDSELSDCVVFGNQVIRMGDR